MRINSVSNTMPKRPATKRNHVNQGNQNNTNSPSFSIRFFIDHCNLKSIDHALHEKVSIYESNYPVKAGYEYTGLDEGLRNFLTNIVNICRPFKEVLPNKEYYFYADEACEDCGGRAPSGIYSLEIHPHPSRSHLRINCGYILQGEELEAKRREMANILIKSISYFNPSSENIELIRNCLNTRSDEVKIPVYTGPNACNEMRKKFDEILNGNEYSSNIS